MMPRYAQINADNIAFAISDLAGPVDAPDMIPLDDGQDVMGMRWTGEGWEAVPPPAPEPISLTVGDLVSRFLIPSESAAFDALDDAMMAEARLVRRNWQIDSYRFTEGDGFWTIVSGHLDEIVTPDRKAELLARPLQSAARAGEEALAA